MNQRNEKHTPQTSSKELRSSDNERDLTHYKKIQLAEMKRFVFKKNRRKDNENSNRIDRDDILL